MNFGNRIVGSIITGWAFAGALIVIVFSSENGKLVTIMLWNVALFVDLAEKGSVISHDSLGNPLSYGLPVHPIFADIGVLSGFVIYPAIIFLLLTLIAKFRLRK